ncbi:MAG: sugar ABC transporter substrate-binding protein [Caldilineaceae bacterium]|nr:sugar ABC transporter substrate-binding protein [Caldilineaceae bacterium]
MYTPSAPLSRRRFLQLVAATAAPLALAACVAPAPSGGGAAPAPDGEKVAVRYIAMDYDSRMQADTQEVIDAFNASQDNIEAALEVVRWADGANVIRTQMSAGQPPDIFNQGGGQLLEYHAADEVEALNDLMGEDFLANFWKSGIDAMSVDGKLYGMPYFLDPRGLYYRSDLFEEQGLKAPETWADVREAAKALHNPPNMYGFGVGVGGPSGSSDYWWYAWVGAIGGGNNLSKWGENGKSLVGNEAGVRAVQFLADLVLTDQTTNPSPVNTGRDEDLQPLFLAGQLAMLETGSWMPTILMNDAPDVKFDLAPLPVAEAGMAHANAFWPDAVLMAKQSQHKPEAAELLKFMFNKENRLNFALQRGVIPERIDVGQDPAYLDPANPVSRFNAIFVKELENAHNVFETPWPASGEADNDEIENGLAKVFLGEATAEEAMAEAATIIDERHGV